MFNDLISEHEPPIKRQSACEGDREQHLTEAAVMLAYANYLLRSIPNVSQVEIHPDGEHAKQFDIRGWLESHGFQRTESIGNTAYGGVYFGNGQTIKVIPRPGEGDVIAKSNGQAIVAECKGGIVNTRHAGQTSKLRRGLCEAVGLLMVRPEGERQIAVVPYTDITLRLAQKIVARTHAAGIEIALIDARGNVLEIKPNREQTVVE